MAPFEFSGNAAIDEGRRAGIGKSPLPIATVAAMLCPLLFKVFPVCGATISTSMKHRSLPLTALRSFESAARHASFSRAAEELGVTHGAVSRQIATLESLLGVPLFLRSQPIRLTEDGQFLFEGIAPSFERIAATVSCLQQDSRGRALRVNAPPTFTMKWLIPRLSGFQRRFRNAEVRLTTGSAEVQLSHRADFDLVIRRLPAAQRDTPAQAFLSGSLVPVCSPDLLEAHPVQAPGDVLAHRLIEASTNTTNWDEWFSRAALPRPEASAFLRFEEMFFSLQAAMDGLGIALVPLTLVTDDLAAGQLAIPLTAPTVRGRDYAYAISPSARSQPLALAFGEWLVEQGESSNHLSEEVVASMAPQRSGAT